jgi:lipoic acid synthetase
MGNIDTDKRRLPSWLKKGVLDIEETRFVRKILKNLNLNTVCEGARCPNKGECYASKTATFLILGNKCTRNCRFCSIEHSDSPEFNLLEPQNVAEAVEKLGLSYTVVTSVTRDDLTDYGAGHFAQTVTAIKARLPNVVVEVLVPDFNGDIKAIESVLDAGVDVFNHNVETINDFYLKARPEADYERSLDVLRYAKSYRPEMPTKTGIMLGLGESLPQLEELFRDLKEVDVNILTIGQYIQPAKHCLEVVKYYTESEFEDIKTLALKTGLENVISGPLVRSSYKAFECFKNIT